MSHYKLNWDSFRNKLCDGLSSLQQNEEFVDMTLAADGYFVKVHKNIVALASPYIKDLLKTAPCSHPVIFLSNIDHKALNYILQYIYIGEVEVPVQELSSFVNLGKQLHISGIASMSSIIPQTNSSMAQAYSVPLNIPNTPITSQVLNLPVMPAINTLSIPDTNHLLSQNDFTLNEPLVTETVDLSNVAASISIDANHELNFELNNLSDVFKEQNYNSTQNLLETSVQNVLETSVPKPKVQSKVNKICKVPKKFNTVKGFTWEKNISLDNNPIYIYSIRGQLQMILNNFIYCIHHKSNQSRRRRWRCINYRRSRCKAFVDTEEDKLVNRKIIHSHPVQLEVIEKKLSRTKFFKSILEAETEPYDPSNPYQYVHDNSDKS